MKCAWCQENVMTLEPDFQNMVAWEVFCCPSHWKKYTAFMKKCWVKE